MVSIKNKFKYRNYKKDISPQKIMGMTSPLELAFLHFYAKKIYTGQGEIVDLGCWLGATSAALAKGLLQNPKVSNKSKRIHAYDLFYWEASLDHHTVGTPYENKFQPGDDYKWLFLENTKEYVSLIETKGDINIDKWNAAPVEFLFIDAMKNKMTTHTILKNFYPFLVPGKSHVAYQDFDHYLTPWVHLLIYIFRNYFEHVCEIPFSGSTIFKLIKPLPDALINTDVNEIKEAEADKAFDYCLKIAAPEKRANIAAAHIMYYYKTSKIAMAKQLFWFYIKKGYDTKSDLQFVQNLLTESND